MNLIAQTYLNLARNEENRDYLVDLQLFKKLKKLVDKYILLEDAIRSQAAGENTQLFTGPRNPISQGFQLETSIVCYINSIFARLLSNDH